jgi:hypothetical protein
LDWIEQLSGWDPDHGDGSLEAAVLLAIFAVLIMVVFFVRQRVNRA